MFPTPDLIGKDFTPPDVIAKVTGRATGLLYLLRTLQAASRPRSKVMRLCAFRRRQQAR